MNTMQYIGIRKAHLAEVVDTKEFRDFKRAMAWARHDELKNLEGFLIEQMQRANNKEEDEGGEEFES